MITLKQIQYALEVSETLNFRRAADNCCISASALSSALGELEKNLGVDLFERNNKTVLLTQFGKEFCEKARKINTLTADIETLATSYFHPLNNHIKVGVIPTISPYLLPTLLPTINSKYPGLSLELIENQSSILIKKLKAGWIDFAILALPFDLEGLSYQRFWEEDFFWITHKNDPKALKKEITADMLEGSNLMLLDEGHCLTEHALEVCKIKNAHRYAIEASSLMTLVQLVSCRMGTTLIPAMAVKQSLASNPLVSAVHLDEPGPHRTIAAIYRPTYPNVEGINLFVDLIRNELKNSSV